MSAGPAETCPDCNGLYQQLEEQGHDLAVRTAERDAATAEIAGWRERYGLQQVAIKEANERADKLEEERDEIDGILEQIDDLLPIREDNPRGRHEVFEDLREELAKRDALAATVERLIREAGAIRLDERQRANAEHDADLGRAHQRAIDRADELERDNARLRRLVDDADRAKAEHEKTRDELRRLHDVLSGAKKL